jgi:hypothetical protein
MGGRACLDMGSPHLSFLSGTPRVSSFNFFVNVRVLISTTNQQFSCIASVMSHSHSHDGPSHSHAAADHGHTHEILDGPGSFMGREMPIIEGRDWEDRAFTIGFGG